MSASPTQPTDDLSALSWVQDELRRSLEVANKALRRYLKEAENASDLDTVDPSVLRQARSQLHQSVGVLELVGLAAPAQVLRAAEAALQRLSAKPRLITLSAVHAIEHGCFAVLEFIDRTLAGKPVPPLALFPQYRTLQELAAASRVHPADLWAVPWSWRSLPPDHTAQPQSPEPTLVEEIEADLLALMRNPLPRTAVRMSERFANLGAGSSGRLATLWQLAAAFFEAQGDGLLVLDAYSKRIGSRLLSQLRTATGGGHGAGNEPSERLAHDLLFFCAQAAVTGMQAAGPRLAAVRAIYGLSGEPAVDLEVPRLGKFDPAWVAQARKRITAAKEVWSAVAGGDVDRLSMLSEQFSLVADSLQRLYPDGGALGRALQVAVAQAAATGHEPPADLAMEVATALLYLDASIDDGDFDQPETAERIQRLAQRIEQVRQGRDPGTLERWMEDLYRRVSDRQTMGSVVQELRASLSEVEKHIDQYFRDPAQREVLIPVPGQLSAMRGVLSVLGLDQASAAVLRMRDDVDALASTEVDPQRAIQAGTFDRLADNLGALSFLIDMVSVQPAMAKSLFRFEAATGLLSATVARADRPTGFDAFDPQPGQRAAQDTDAMAVTLEFDRLVRQAQATHAPPQGQHGLPMIDAAGLAAASPVSAADEPVTVRLGNGLRPDALTVPLDMLRGPLDAPADATMRLPLPPDDATMRLAMPADDVTMRLPMSADDATLRLALPSDEVTLRVSPPPFNPPPAPAPVAPVSSGLDDDPEMREVFLDEAREVLAAAREGVHDLQQRHDDAGAMTTVRRAFHTLKGSARMVGLQAFGEAAWSCEQLYNARLSEHAGADVDLREFTLEAAAHFERWVDAIAAGDDQPFDPADVRVAADSLRTEHRRLAIGGAPLATQAVAPPDLALTADADPTEPGVFHPAPSLPPLALQVPELPSASDLDLPDLGAWPVEELQPADLVPASLDLSLPPEPPAAPEAVLPDLDLAALDAEAIDVGEALHLDTFELAPVADESPAPDTADAALPDLLLDDDAGVPVVAAEPDVLLDGDAAGTDLPLDLPDAVELSDTPDNVPAEAFKQIGPLRIGIPLFNIFINEADEQSRRLHVELAEWSHELYRPVGEAAVALAHSLAGNAATVGYGDLSQLARELEHALERSQASGHGQADDAALYLRAADEIIRLLHLFAAGFLNTPDAALVDALHARAHAAPDAVVPADADSDLPLPIDTAADLPLPELAPGALVADTGMMGLGRIELLPLPQQAAPAAAPQPVQRDGGVRFDDEIDAVDAVDAELFPIFVEEAHELLPQLQSRLRDWSLRPADAAAGAAAMRPLHTFKGGARLSGAMRLGELAHRLETEVERLTAQPSVASADIDQLLAHADAVEAHFDGLRRAVLGGGPDTTMAPLADWAAPATPVEPAAAALAAPAPALATPAPATIATDPATTRSDVVSPALADTAAATPLPAIDWQRFGAAPVATAAEQAAMPASATVAGGLVRVRAPLLDRLVNQAGEVSIARTRIDADVHQMKASLGDLTDNLERLRAQLRDIELQAETQIATRLEAARASAQGFDPLEMDRFTRFQELTRMMAESVADVATVQRGLQRSVQSAEDALAHQGRMARGMQDDLLRTRMVEFDGLSERLYRVVRQAAKETGKPVRLDIVGASIEIDRGVLDRMTASFEHLLRNSVVHGIEPAAVRSAAGKDATGNIAVTVSQAGNEVMVEVRDDGAGLDLPRIEARGRQLGLLAPGAIPTDNELANLVFQPGFSTADQVTDLAGRGVGMDVVRTEVNAMGGRIETASAPGQGASFRLVLPLTTAVTQVVMLRCGERSVAVPATLVDVVLRVPLDSLAPSYASGRFQHDGHDLPLFWLDGLLQAGGGQGPAAGRSAAVVIIRSAAQRIALHVDEVAGNQEVVIKNLGPQLSRLPGLVGMTLLPSGLPALIYNPVALATLYGDAARAAARATLAQADAQGLWRSEAAATPPAPLVLVVDDSLTVRRVTQRLLQREGYRVLLAKDGFDGLDKLAGELPAVVLTDIEMPRMDGFDMVRNMKGDARLAALPLVMITSRLAQKHRDYAAELGVDHYLGKPYDEQELLRLVARHARAAAAA